MVKILDDLKNKLKGWWNKISGKTTDLGTSLTLLEKEIYAFRNSPRRKEMIQGELYYEGIQDVLERQRTSIGKDGVRVPVPNLPNNKIIDNQYGKLVDQKVNYVLGKPITFNGENKEYLKALKKVFNKRFHKSMRNVCKNALNNGLSYLFPYYDEKGDLKFKIFKGSEIIPHWKDSEHTEIEDFIRIYRAKVINNDKEDFVDKVEYYSLKGVERFTLKNNQLIKEDSTTYLVVEEEQEDGTVTQKGYNWEKLPLIAFKFNDNELPLIRRVKSLQDGINAILSDFTNNMQEDARNTILVIKNYGGQNLGEFRENLVTYGAIKVNSTSEQQGGVETLTIEVNAENYKAILEIFKKALIENGRGLDVKSDILGGNPNQMNIQSMYSDLDLDANEMETEFQASFEDLMWFINTHLQNKGLATISEDEELEVIFNRDILINEAQTIENCKNSVGIISNKTIASMHPWTKDTEYELKQIEEDKQKELEQFNNYNDQNNNDPNNPNNNTEV